MGTRQSRSAARGAVAPDFTLPAVDGATGSVADWTLSAQLGEGPIVLVFLRGFS